MQTGLKMSAALLVAMAVTLGASPAADAQAKDKAAASRPVSKPPHRVVIQISEDDPKLMNVALNNAENLTKYYQDRGETVQIEIVAFGPGLAMMRSDVSPVKSRLQQFASSLKNVSFSGCGNTLASQSARENKELTLLPEAHLVPAGIARIVELEEQGWAYVRP